MNGGWGRTTELSLGEAFAEHLRHRGSASAAAFADRLAQCGDGVRADLLRAFAQGGQQVLPADWWQPGSVVHLSLGLPEAAKLGDLWFDPLEVSCALVTPWLGHPRGVPFHGWVSLEPVREWQLLGAHQVSPQLPRSSSTMTGIGAGQYCVLFGKLLTTSVGWQFLHGGYGEQVVRRMWGGGRAEFGGSGRISGEVEVLTLDEMLSWNPFDHYAEHEIAEASELDVLDMRFHTQASLQIGLYDSEDTLKRTWHPY